MHIRRTHNDLVIIPDSDEAIQDSPPPDDAISYGSPRSIFSLLHVPHNDPSIHNNLSIISDPSINNDLFIDDDPFINYPPPARNESPQALQDEINIHYHPLINGVYTVVRPCSS
jgi:hypothetical protein